MRLISDEDCQSSGIAKAVLGYINTPAFEIEKKVWKPDTLFETSSWSALENGPVETNAIGKMYRHLPISITTSMTLSLGTCLRFQ